jgi:hypothetical protein
MPRAKAVPTNSGESLKSIPGESVDRYKNQGIKAKKKRDSWIGPHGAADQERKYDPSTPGIHPGWKEIDNSFR